VRHLALPVVRPEIQGRATDMRDRGENDMKDIDELKAELQWAIANNEERPRTESALKWALEAIEELEKEGEGA
jgi:hypothetical protein